MRLAPANAVVDIGQGGRIGCYRRDTEIQRRHYDPIPGQRLVGGVADQAVSSDPGAAVQLYHNRERPSADGPEHPRQHRLISVAEIFHVLYFNFVG